MFDGSSLDKSFYYKRIHGNGVSFFSLAMVRRRKIICCPEDVLRCDDTVHLAHMICEKCAVPICHVCHGSFLKKWNIPMAWGNHNYIGYVSKTLVEYNVRFIEAAIVCPVWTSLICHYLEEDHGRTMKEEVHVARHRIGVRGNILSFLIPWKDVMDSLRRVQHTKELLLHPPEVLSHVVRLHMKVGGDYAEVFKFVKEAKVRAQVILKLGRELIENHHPACTKKGTGGTRVLKADAAELYRLFSARCEQYHTMPTEDQDIIDGVIPGAVMKIIKAGVTAKQSATLLQSKNAVPPLGVTTIGEVFDGVQPQGVVLQRTLGAGQYGNEPLVAA